MTEPDWHEDPGSLSSGVELLSAIMLEDVGVVGMLGMPIGKGSPYPDDSPGGQSSKFCLTLAARTRLKRVQKAMKTRISESRELVEND